MHITIYAVGKLKDRHLADGVAKYLKYLEPYARVETVEVRNEPFTPEDGEKERGIVLDREGERLARRLRRPSYVVALDVAGKMLSSPELAALIGELQLGGKSDLSFLIGGALGLSPALKEKADLRLSFSRLTLPHQMARLILAEQLYRAFKIIKNEPYHW